MPTNSGSQRVDGTSNIEDQNRLLDGERDPNRVHRLLASERRRFALDVLADAAATNGTVTLGELASDLDRLERAEADTPETPDSDLLVELHHAHLPMFEAAGVLEYDPDSKTIRF